MVRRLGLMLALLGLACAEEGSGGDAESEAIVEPSRGVHLVLDASFLRGDTAIMVPQTDDGRVLFVIPWHDRCLVGTTDTEVPEAVIEPRPLAEASFARPCAPSPRLRSRAPCRRP